MCFFYNSFANGLTGPDFSDVVDAMKKAFEALDLAMGELQGTLTYHCDGCNTAWAPAAPLTVKCTIHVPFNFGKLP
jgi:hypothetical protein